MPDGTHNITLEMAQLQKIDIHVIPGWKLCGNCHQKTKHSVDLEDLNIHDNDYVNELEPSQMKDQR